MSTIHSRVALLSNFLTCRHCLQLFDTREHFPKLLDCFHSICQHCVQTLTVTDPSSQVSCPSCSITRPIPSTGFLDNELVLNHLQSLQDIVGFVPPQAFKCGACFYKDAVAYCEDWAMNVCKGCIDLHHLVNITTIREVESHLNDVEEKLTVKNKTCEHYTSRRKRRFLTMFRSTRKSQMTACSKCSAKTLRGRITSVDTQALEEHHVMGQNKLLELLTEQCRDKSRSLYSLSPSFDEHMAKLEIERVKKEADIDQKFGRLIDDLNRSRDAAKLEVHKTCEEKKRSLQTQKSELRSICAELEGAFAFADQMCRFSTPEKCLELQQKVTARMKEMIERDDEENIKELLQHPFNADSKEAVKTHDKADIEEHLETVFSDTPVLDETLSNNSKTLARIRGSISSFCYVEARAIISETKITRHV